MRIGVTESELSSLQSKRRKFPHLYKAPFDFYNFFGSRVDGAAICPGFTSRHEACVGR